MTEPPKNRAHTRVVSKGTTRTAGHDVSIGFGGGRQATLFVYVCQDCNGAQGCFTFRAWAIRLAKEGDRRAAGAHAVADLFDEWRGRPEADTVKAARIASRAMRRGLY